MAFHQNVLVNDNTLTTNNLWTWFWFLAWKVSKYLQE